ncbi:substrate-binding domain-containing protein [Anaerocolumna xylanovorans]|uniref:Ribose transport system substrate-binding protein n=1 Tax=Anaerocolumna xylanovorans DSM 12503 TaxID=1121345 RepID=A0A1M7XZW5_9FIRM|nr:substrate-binding domain-containing protein [Anaerocolumna xylanovorans]SHO44544.1 ribose transport system substrate-binding protein [Anaerocolumna xylanovorans DSM 12503]
MKRKVLSILLCTALVVAMFTGCSSKDKGSVTTDSGSKGESYKVYLITMDQMDQYWANIDKGCKKAVDELKESGITVDYKWSAPDKKDDAQQIEKINNAVADGAKAILLAANGPTAVNASLKEAEAAGVKIVYVDSPADYPAVRTLTTDNEAAGKTAGEKLIEALKAKNITSGDIGIISVNTSTDSTMKRENGFRSAFEGTQFKILETQYCEGEAAQSQNAASNFLAQGCVGLYGCNEGSTVGVGNAIKEAGGSVVGIGFDTSDAILELIEQGYLLGAMAQNPSTMGYEGIKTAVKAIKGEEAGENLDTGVTAVTKDNVADFKK